MASTVIKKDGTKEPFDAEKIRNSIRAAIRDANLSEDRGNEIVEQVTATVLQVAGEKEEITTSEIREKILSELDNIESSVSSAWRKYDQEHKNI